MIAVARGTRAAANYAGPGSERLAGLQFDHSMMLKKLLFNRFARPWRHALMAYSCSGMAGNVDRVQHRFGLYDINKTISSRKKSDCTISRWRVVTVTGIPGEPAPPPRAYIALETSNTISWTGAIE